MPRYAVYRALWIGWYLFLSACAGYGAFTFAFNVGLGPDWAFIVGTLAFVCIITIFDRDLGSRDPG